MRSRKTLLLLLVTTIVVAGVLLTFLMSPTIISRIETITRRPKEIQFEEGRFQVVSPYTFRKSKEQAEISPDKTFELTVYTASQRDNAYFIAFTDINQSNVSTSELIQGGEANFLRNINGTIDKRNEITVSGYPGIEVIAHGNFRDTAPVIGLTRIIATETRLYVVTTMTLNQQRPTELMYNFIYSFRIND